MKDHVYLSKNEFNSKSFCSLQRGRQEFKQAQILIVISSSEVSIKWSDTLKYRNNQQKLYLGTFVLGD